MFLANVQFLVVAVIVNHLGREKMLAVLPQCALIRERERGEEK